MEPNVSSKLESQIDPDLKFFLVQIHATCFIFAWFFVTVLASASARYLRHLMPNYKPFGLLLWFHIHRTLNLFAIALMAAGLLVVFIAYEWRWTGPKPNGTKNLSPGSLHTLFGISGCVLAFIQPVLAWFRCAPSHQNRETFNKVHRILGCLSWLFATICLGIACFYFKKRLISTEAAFALFLANLVLIVVVTIGLEYYSSYKQKEKRVSENGKASNRRSASIPYANCLVVTILSLTTLTVSTLICILVWLKR
ncbi:hypothetical protein M3Y97_00428800 [Aphelenchoides bicaudatus]|nr:hypothetical protein M3Y97_00428800 [Aphelenchoides bicaudatus]